MDAAKEEIEPVCGHTDIDELMDNAVSFPDVSRRIKLSIEALHRHRIAGRIKAFKIGKTYFTTTAAVMDFLRAGGEPESKTFAATPGAVPSRLRKKQIAAAMREADRLGV